MTDVRAHDGLSLLRKLGVVLLVTLVLFASLLFYLQTRPGFRHVIVPLAALATLVSLDQLTMRTRDGE